MAPVRSARFRKAVIRPGSSNSLSVARKIAVLPKKGGMYKKPLHVSAASSSGVPRTGKKTSEVWQYFKPLPQTPGQIATSICTLCNAVCRIPGGSTTGMRGHLKSKHGELGLLSSPPGTVPSKRVEATPVRRPIPKPTPPETDMKTLSSSDEARKKFQQDAVNLQSTVPRETDSECEETVRNMAFFCIMDLKPLATVEGDGFRGMLSHFDQNYIMKCVNEPEKVKTVAECVDDLYQLEHRKAVDDLRHRYLNLTVETWDRNNIERYVLVTTNQLAENWKMESKFIAVRMLPEPMSSRTSYKESTLASIKESLASFEIKMKYVHSMVVYSNDFEEVDFFEGSCLLPCLNQVVNKCFENLKIAIFDIFDEDVVTNCMEAARRYLHDYDTLSRNPYCLFMSILASRAQLDMHEHSIIPQNYLSTLTKLLSPLNDIIEISRDITTVSGFVSISTILPLMFALKDQLVAYESSVENYNDEKPFISTFVGVIMKTFGDSYGIDFDSNDYSLNVVCLSAFLDPRYKGLKFVNDAQKKSIHQDALQMLNLSRQPAKQGRASLKHDNLEEPYSNGRPGSRRSHFTAFLRKIYEEYEDRRFGSDAETELRHYLDHPIPPITTDPLVWWRTNSAKFPSLSIAARRILGIPANGSKAENVFSKQGIVYDAERSALEPEHLEKLLFLNKTFAASVALSPMDTGDD